MKQKQIIYHKKKYQDASLIHLFYTYAYYAWLEGIPHLFIQQPMTMQSEDS